MGSALDVLYFCPSCGRENRAPGAAPSAGSLPCRHCGRSLEPAAPEALTAGGPIARCAVCGEDKLYVQKDFNQKVGCLIVGAGAVLVPWTYGLSLAVCALADWIAYRLLPFATVCYVCRSRYRGAPANPDHRPFDLMAAQTWEARALNWRRRHDRSAARAD